MAQLGKEQRHAKRQGAAEAEQVRESRQKTLPVARDQKHPQPQDDRQAVTQQPRPEPRQPRPRPVEKRVGAPKRNTEKQILVQQHLPQASLLRGGFMEVTGALLRVEGGDQVMGAQKAQQLLDFAAAQRQTRLSVGRLQDVFRVAQGPVAQQANGGRAEFEIAPAYRVGQGPARRAVQGRAGTGQLQVFTQFGQAHQRPTLWRRPASGLRNKYRASGARSP